MNDDIVKEYYTRAAAGMNAHKRRAGIFHVSDYATPCARRAYLQHTSVPKMPDVYDNRRALIKGEAEHQLLDKGANMLERVGETAVCWDLVNNREPPYDAGDPPAPNDMPVKFWLQQILGEFDAVYQLPDGQKILVDYKTKLEFNPKQEEADEDHRDQLNIYNYLRSKYYGLEPLTHACVVYIVSGTNDPTHVWPYTFELDDIDKVQERLQDRQAEFTKAHEDGTLPARVLPIGHFRGYGHHACGFCPYRDRCMTRQPGGLHTPSDWEHLTEFERELNVL